MVMGYLFAIVGAIRWLFVIPAAPVLVVVVIALCVMVIYGLAKHSDYVRAPDLPSSIGCMTPGCPMVIEPLGATYAGGKPHLPRPDWIHSALLRAVARCIGQERIRG